MNSEMCDRAAAMSDGPTFEETVLPHLDAGRRLARWMVRNDEDAEDVVQDAALRAFRYFQTFTGGNGRAWFLRIVRNNCLLWRRPRPSDARDSFDEQQHSDRVSSEDPETLLLQTDSAMLIDRSLGHLSPQHRDVLVMRELHGLSYQELADTLAIPIGTVMSSLARARRALRVAINEQLHAREASVRRIHETGEPHIQSTADFRPRQRSAAAARHRRPEPRH